MRVVLMFGLHVEIKLVLVFRPACRWTSARMRSRGWSVRLKSLAGAWNVKKLFVHSTQILTCRTVHYQFNQTLK